MFDNETQFQLTRIADREAIRDVMYAYCRGVDRRDLSLIKTAYHEDAFDDHGNFSGGPEALLEKVSKDPSGLKSIGSMHHIGNISFSFLDSRTAIVESYFIAVNVFKHENGEFVDQRAGRYVDRFEKRQGRWAIAERKVVDDWAIRHEKELVPEVGRHKGLRNKHDVIYSVLEPSREHELFTD